MSLDPNSAHADRPCVVVAVMHPAMRAMIVELLDRDEHAWSVIAVADPHRLAAVLAAQPIDLVVVDGVDFPACCCDLIDGVSLDHVVVIGAEPDEAYEAAALRRGAGAWLPRDRVGEDLGPAMRDLLSTGSDHRRSVPDRRETLGFSTRSMRRTFEDGCCVEEWI